MKPIGKRLIVKPVVKAEEKKGLLILPENKQKTERMEIIALSEDYSGLINTFSIGCHVLLEKYAGQGIIIDGEEVFIVKEEQVIAIF